MIKRVLVGLAGTNYTPVAIERAVTLVQEHDAEITGVTVVDPRRLHGSEQTTGAAPMELPGQQRAAIPISPDCIEESIQHFEQSCEEAGVRHCVLRESRDTCARLIDAARYLDVMVLGLHSVQNHALPGGDPDALLNPARGCRRTAAHCCHEGICGASRAY